MEASQTTSTVTEEVNINLATELFIPIVSLMFFVYRLLKNEKWTGGIRAFVEYF